MLSPKVTEVADPRIIAASRGFVTLPCGGRKRSIQVGS